MDGIALVERNHSRRFFLPTVAAGALILSVIGWLGCEIPRGLLTHTDELTTAERAREMLLTSRWGVPFNFQVAFDKPPLQYWLTTLTLPRFRNPSVAVRFWPLLYGCFTLIATAWLAFLIDRNRPWLMPLTVALLGACPLFLLEATAGLLDSGLTFFTTMAIVFAQLARKKSIWWWGVAAMSWLGALQKNPLILLIWLFILLIRACSPTERRTLQSPRLPISVGITLSAIAIWPLIQILRHGMPLNRVLGLNDLMQLLGYVPPGLRPYYQLPFHVGVFWWMGGVILLTSAIVLLYVRERYDRPGLTESAVVCLLFLGMALLFRFREFRYIMLILPLACVVLAAILHWLLEQRATIRAAGLVLMATLLSVGLIEAKVELDRRFKKTFDEKGIAEALGRLQRKDTRIVFVEDPVLDKAFHYPFYLFYGNLKFPMDRYSADQLSQAPPSRPVMGLCLRRDFPRIKEVYPDVKIEVAKTQIICWQVPGGRSP